MATNPTIAAPPVPDGVGSPVLADYLRRRDLWAVQQFQNAMLRNTAEPGFPIADAGRVIAAMARGARVGSRAGRRATRII
jgi:hypothetical protein